MIDIDLQLFKNVITEGRHNTDLLDSYSSNQFKSKELLVKHINSLNILNENSEVVIFGCWYGSLLIPAFKNVKRITAIDIDKNVISIAKNRLFNHYKNVDFIIFDEATSNLDKKGVDDLCEIQKKIKNNKIIINISHSDIVLNISDKIFEIKDNKIISI